MNRYETTFAATRAQKRTAFIPFAVAGDPDLSQSEAIFKTYVDAGADILEIGYPFSDPIADGPVNQRAAIRSLAARTDHDRFFRLMKTLRGYTDIPFGLLVYANTVIHLGYDTFCKRAADSGVDSVLIADLPPEEGEQFNTARLKNDLASVYIVSELTPRDRMAMICKEISGFVYVVSRLGPTGAAKDLGSAVKPLLQSLKKVTRQPLCVGFGVSTPDQVAALGRSGADGVIVGSALVKTIESSLGDSKGMITKLYKQVCEYRKATV